MTQTRDSQNKTSSIYPGEYEPPPGREEEFSKDSKNRGSEFPAFPVNIISSPTYYKVEIPAPGHTRDDFMIYANGKMLSICGFKKTGNIKTAGEQDVYQKHQFTDENIRQSISLPYDSDTGFSYAEYSNGVLVIYVYKAEYPGEDLQTRIMVY